MSTRKLLIGFILSALFFFTLGFQLAADGYRLRFDSRELDFDIVKTISSSSQEGDLDLGLFWEVYSLLKEKYYHDDQLDKQELVDGAIAGMVEAIGDPYTYYLSSSETDTFQDGLDGKYEGIGVQLGYKNDNLIVVAPLEGGPAEKENVKAGDIILAINGESTANMNLGEVVQRVRGEDGSEVSLALARQNATNDVE
ncbi:PDZ domain-containing protein, partial [candidate division WWE3 bacterium]|nr:PDZ domain-containing protein [candidate division WWE3 bacterium]